MIGPAGFMASPSQPDIAFDVFLRGRKIDTVYYPPHCSSVGVRDDLIQCGWDTHIVVIRQKEPK